MQLPDVEGCVVQCNPCQPPACLIHTTLLQMMFSDFNSYISTRLLLAAFNICVTVRHCGLCCDVCVYRGYVPASCCWCGTAPCSQS
jgi:hypothetical protein